MRTLRRARRPLLALVALLIAVAIGYGVRAASTDGRAAPTPTTSAGHE